MFFSDQLLQHGLVFKQEKLVDAFDLLDRDFEAHFSRQALPVLQLSSEARIRGDVVRDLLAESLQVPP